MLALSYIGFLVIINKRKAGSSILKNLYNIEHLKFYVAVLFWIMAKPENKREEELRAATCETEKQYRMKFHRLINFIINLNSKLMNDGNIYIYI